MREKIQKWIHEYGLSKYEQKILNHLVPTLFIKAERADHLPVGTSKIGGQPDLPPEWEYPTYQEYPLTFIAQYRLEDLQGYAITQDFPSSGMLYFFCDDGMESGEGVWGEQSQKDGWRVYYYDGDMTQLTPYQGEHYTYPQAKMVFEVREVLHTDFWLEEALKEEDHALYALFDKSYEGINPVHQIGGIPYNIQGPVFDECMTKRSNPEWVLLLQMDTDDDLNMMWGDSGVIYFCIPREALVEKKFDETWFVMQCF